MVAMKVAHAAVNLKLYDAVASAQEEIATFFQNTSQQLGGFIITTDISLHCTVESTGYRFGGQRLAGHFFLHPLPKQA
jgi:hypothetical protein